jgi:hypothetical protein
VPNTVIADSPTGLSCPAEAEAYTIPHLPLCFDVPMRLCLLAVHQRMPRRAQRCPHNAGGAADGPYCSGCPKGRFGALTAGNAGCTRARTAWLSGPDASPPCGSPAIDPKLCPVQPALSRVDTGGAASWPLGLTAHTTLRRVQLETLGVRSLPAATHRVPLPARPPPPLRCHGPHDPAMRVRA